jgi:hypothetical protein
MFDSYLVRRLPPLEGDFRHRAGPGSVLRM